MLNIKFTDEVNLHQHVRQKDDYQVGSVVIINVDSPDGVLGHASMQDKFSAVMSKRVDPKSRQVEYLLSNGYLFTADQLLRPDPLAIEVMLVEVLKQIDG